MGFPDVSATIFAVSVWVIVWLTFSLSNYTAEITTEAFLFNEAELFQKTSFQLFISPSLKENILSSLYVT